MRTFPTGIPAGGTSLIRVEQTLYTSLAAAQAEADLGRLTLGGQALPSACVVGYAFVAGWHVVYLLLPPDQPIGNLTLKFAKQYQEESTTIAVVDTSGGTTFYGRWSETTSPLLLLKPVSSRCAFAANPEGWDDVGFYVYESSSSFETILDLGLTVQNGTAGGPLTLVSNTVHHASGQLPPNNERTGSNLEFVLCSAPLRGVRSIPAAKWDFSIAYSLAEIWGGTCTGNADKVCLYIWRPDGLGGGSVVGLVFDNTNGDGHPAGIRDGGGATTAALFSIAGAAVAGVQDGDVLVAEITSRVKDTGWAWDANSSVSIGGLTGSNNVIIHTPIDLFGSRGSRGLPLLPFPPEQRRYGVKRPGGAMLAQLAGAAPRVRRGKAGSWARLSVLWQLDPDEFEQMCTFHDDTLALGVLPFLADLYLSQGVLTRHQARFVAGSWTPISEQAMETFIVTADLWVGPPVVAAPGDVGGGGCVPPVIESVTPMTAVAGDTITITGQHLTGATAYLVGDETGAHVLLTVQPGGTDTTLTAIVGAEWDTVEDTSATVWVETCDTDSEPGFEWGSPPLISGPVPWTWNPFPGSPYDVLGNIYAVWDSIPGAVSYRVYKAALYAGPWTEAQFVASVPARSDAHVAYGNAQHFDVIYPDFFPVIPGTSGEAYYRIRSVGASGVPGNFGSITGFSWSVGQDYVP